MISMYICVVVAAMLLPTSFSQYVPKNPDNAQEKNVPRHHLLKELEALLIKQVSEELYASMNYMAMSSHFADDEINRPGFAKYFKKASQEEWEHAHKFVEYLSKRGSALKELNIRSPPKFTWKNGLQALTDARGIENVVTDNLTTIHKLAAAKSDAHLTDFIEGDFLGEQIESMRELSGYISNLAAMSHKGDDHQHHNALSEFLFDEQLLKKD